MEAWKGAKGGKEAGEGKGAGGGKEAERRMKGEVGGKGGKEKKRKRKKVEKNSGKNYTLHDDNQTNYRSGVTEGNWETLRIL